MDPSSPVQIAAWIVAGLLALLSGGCADMANMKALDGSGRPFFDGAGSSYIDAPIYYAPVRQRPLICTFAGNTMTCS